MTTYNTAGAARLVAEGGNRAAAAIAAPRVASIYGLDVLAADVQTGDDNRTRFAVLGREGAVRAVDGLRRPDLPATPPRTTLAFAVRNVPGSLYRCLGAFATRDINLTRLESRPARTVRWEYVFWVDVDGDPADPTFAAALDDLRERCEMVRVLGTYPRAPED
jgi:prephenate dehydratase/chorismate mutase/prephenate dehydratase